MWSVPLGSSIGSLSGFGRQRKFWRVGEAATTSLGRSGFRLFAFKCSSIKCDSLTSKHSSSFSTNCGKLIGRSKPAPASLRLRWKHSSPLLGNRRGGPCARPFAVISGAHKGRPYSFGVVIFYSAVLRCGLFFDRRVRRG